jgi:hypothetical protein
LAAPAPRSQNKRIKYMFIVQRYGLKPAVGLHRGSLIPGVDLDWGGAICGSPRKRLGGNRNPQISKRPAEPDVLAQLCVQVRKIAMRTTVAAITATEIFVNVTNVRYVCS